MQSNGLDIIKEENRLNSKNNMRDANSVDFKENTFGLKPLLKK
jgi:hypothetical protein